MGISPRGNKGDRTTPRLHQPDRSNAISSPSLSNPTTGKPTLSPSLINQWGRGVSTSLDS
ncbi:hypothetical protein [Trichothermofontia sp.]